jgi:hypothetical protein
MRTFRIEACHLFLVEPSTQTIQRFSDMLEDIIAHECVDPYLNSYEQFFDHDWCKRIVELVEDSPLKSAIASLMVAWRSTNGAHMLPWLMVHSLRRFAEGEYEGGLQFRANYSGEVVNGIVDKLEARMHDNLKLDQRVALKRVVTRIEEEAFQALKTAESGIELGVAKYWDFLVRSSEFQFCILGIQRINYGSLFFAYEDFLANTIRTKDPKYSSKSKSIKDAFPMHFGEPLADYCWTHVDVDLAKLVRHALAHNGGRIGPDLDKYKAYFVDETGTAAPLLRGDRFTVVDGKIQIYPCSTTHLFSLLKARVSKIVEELA